MNLLGSTKVKITKDKYGENVLHLEITEIVLVYCNIANNNYQEDSRVLHTFIPKKLLGKLLIISPNNFLFLKTSNSVFSYIEVWFTNQNSKLLDIENKINITLIIN